MPFMQDTVDQKVRQPIALVVDDEPLVRMDTADMVEDEGFEVIEARTAQAAFKFLEIIIRSNSS